MLSQAVLFPVRRRQRLDDPEGCSNGLCAVCRSKTSMHGIGERQRYRTVGQSDTSIGLWNEDCRMALRSSSPGIFHWLAVTLPRYNVFRDAHIYLCAKKDSALFSRSKLVDMRHICVL